MFARYVLFRSDPRCFPTIPGVSPGPGARPLSDGGNVVSVAPSFRRCDKRLAATASCDRPFTIRPIPPVGIQNTRNPHSVAHHAQWDIGARRWISTSDTPTGKSTAATVGHTPVQQRFPMTRPVLRERLYALPTSLITFASVLGESSFFRHPSINTGFFFLAAVVVDVPDVRGLFKKFPNQCFQK